MGLSRKQQYFVLNSDLLDTQKKNSLQVFTASKFSKTKMKIELMSVNR